VSAGAVVIGGGLAGLVAARVLSEHLPRVTLVERDRLSPTPSPRRGTPQGHHQHTLMPRGRWILEQLFPGLEADLLGRGAVRFDLARDVAWLTRQGWACRFPSGLDALSCSRELLEWAMRQRVSARPGVEVRSGWAASGLRLDTSGRAICGIRLRQERRQEVTLPADLVVDASGRGSKTPTWLEALGFPRPDEQVIDPSVGYASRTYRRPAAVPADWTVAYIQSAPPRATRGGMLLPIEEGRWRVSLVGYCGDHPPSDEAGFLEFSRTLRSPLIHDAIRHAEPVSPIAGGRSSANRLHRYDTLARRPEGLLVLGDAACAFNPVFAQGMTMAAIGAMVLDRCLRERGDLELAGRSLAERFQRRLAAAQAGAWRLDRLVDTPLAGLDGRIGPRDRVLRRYLAELGRRGCTRPSARRATLELAGLVRTPPGILRAGLVLALMPWREGGARGAAQPAAADVTGADRCGRVSAESDSTETLSDDGATFSSGRR
jgi:2-polyprenyl-6-methoxyphenol hydroxylase-like FAD-dependent oxidoreductase